MNIILADDHIIFREGLNLLLSNTPNNNIIAQANDAIELKELVQNHQPDLVIMDYHMPNGDTMATLEYINSRFPKIKIIVLTGSHSGMLLKRLSESSADAVLLKENSAYSLNNVIAEVFSGKRVIPDAVLDKIQQDDFDLTKREYQVLGQIVKGHNSQEMADILGISAKTVGKHRENVMKKMNVNNVAQLVALAFRLNLVGE